MKESQPGSYLSEPVGKFSFLVVFFFWTFFGILEAKTLSTAAASDPRASLFRLSQAVY